LEPKLETQRADTHGTCSLLPHLALSFGRLYSIGKARPAHQMINGSRREPFIDAGVFQKASPESDPRFKLLNI
jgi:hypothetical protein